MDAVELVPSVVKEPLAVRLVRVAARVEDAVIPGTFQNANFLDDFL